MVRFCWVQVWTMVTNQTLPSLNHHSHVKCLWEILPLFRGWWVPRLDMDKSTDLHCAILPLLLKPWCSLSNLHVHFDWGQDLSQFLVSSDSWMTWIASNFQKFHDAIEEYRMNTIFWTPSVDYFSLCSTYCIFNPCVYYFSWLIYTHCRYCFYY